jgi:methylated-DNA-[protein]-cysteine S-methyltransferase
MTAACWTSLRTILGELILVSDGRSLTTIRFAREEGALLPEGAVRRPKAEPFPETVRQLSAYLDRGLQNFNLPLAPAGTPFQRAVWDELLRIPYGSTTTYGELARRLGRPRATRAVGGGLDLKRRLLVLEGALP